MRSSWIVLATILLSAACRHAVAPRSSGGPSPPEPAVTEETSGQRLKVVWVVGPAGERRFSAWYDAKLDLECSFGIASDGKKRCLPTKALGTGNAFADSACSVPAVLTFGPIVSPSSFYKVQTPACPPRITVGRVGAEVPLESLFETSSFRRVAKSGLSSFQPLGCRQAGIPQLRGYSLGEVVPPETFVAAEIHRQETRGPVGLTMLDGEDGSRDVSTWYDSRLGRDCLFERSADGALRCLPHTRAMTLTGFSDDQCSAPAASMIVKPSTCEQVDFVRARPPGECPQRTHLFRGGPRLAAAFEDYGSAGCQPSTDEHYQVGAEVPAAELPAGTTRTWRAGAGPLAVELLEAGGMIVRRDFIDQRFDLPCYPNTCQGDTRCVPPADAIAGEVFADPECQQPLAGRKLGACISRLARTSQRARLTGDWDPCVEPFFVVGALHHGAIYKKAYRAFRIPNPGDTLQLDESNTSCIPSDRPDEYEELYRVERRFDRTELVKLHFERR